MHSHPVISYHKVIKYSILRTKKSLPVRQTLFYGDNGTRTRGLCVANASLSQLSYIPVQTYCSTLNRKIKKKFGEIREIKRANPVSASSTSRSRPHPPAAIQWVRKPICLSLRSTKYLTRDRPELLSFQEK